jgi:hypothetical protein
MNLGVALSAFMPRRHRAPIAIRHHPPVPAPQCEQIAALSDQLARAETDWPTWRTTRRTLTAQTGEPEATDPADATMASVAYQQVLAVFTTGMRAKDACLALGLGTTPKTPKGYAPNSNASLPATSSSTSGQACSPLATTAPYRTSRSFDRWSAGDSTRRRSPRVGCSLVPGMGGSVRR